MKDFIKNFEDKFFKYKENIFNDISIISTTIDPRFKLDYFKEFREEFKEFSLKKLSNKKLKMFLKFITRNIPQLL
jgi:hypothetical protein